MPGRRAGPTRTRQSILDAARAAFAELGYDATTIRLVARSAGVDPALVHHFFSNKPGLFAAASESVSTDDIVKKILESVKEPDYSK